MEKFTTKNLAECIKYVFKSNNQQIMLTKITDNEEFFPFLQGSGSVQVLCPSKETFLAKIKHLDETPGCFQLYPAKKNISVPKLEVDDTLVLLFQLARGAYVSQAKVTGIVVSKVKVIAVDPRLNTRFKTRVPISFFPINQTLFNQFKTQKASVKRVIEYADPQNMADPRQCRDFLVLPPVESIDPAPHLACTEETQNALMGDLSLGGCCLYVPPPAPIPAIRNYMFVFIEIPLPSVEKRVSASLFAVVRHIRQSKRWVILHCMFLESLPPELSLF